MEDKALKDLLAQRPDIAEAIQDGKVQLKWYCSDPPRCELYWPDIGKQIPISLENSDALWSWATVQKAMLATWRVVACDDLKPKDWHACLTILIAKAEVVEEHGASMAAEILDILDYWLEEHHTDAWSVNDLYNQALYKDGYYYFRTEVFEQKALFAQNTRFYYQRYLIPRPKLYEIFRGAGARSISPRFRGDVHKRAWQIPEGFNKPGADEPEGQIEFEEKSSDEELSNI